MPDGEPELLHPSDVTWARGQVFRTREARGEAVWVVTPLDREAHAVEYHRVEPGRCVARVAVHCTAPTAGRTEVRVTYAFVGLSPEGNDEIAAMTDDEYARKVERWARWIRARRA